jgi:lysozyme family protein
MQKVNYVYIWNGVECPTCSEMDGTEFYDEKDINPKPPLHPNCKCYISVLEIDKTGKIKPTNIHFKNALNKTLKSEGGFAENNGRKDQPTNMGIKNNTLNDYNKIHPRFNFPDKVKDLTPEQAEQIYKMEYWVKGRFDEINNTRIRDALFDINVMSGPSISGKQLQESLNNFNNSNIKVDGIMGSKTIKEINDIPSNKINDFMDILKNNRMEHLQNGDKEKWEENKNGWTIRTLKY